MLDMNRQETRSTLRDFPSGADIASDLRFCFSNQALAPDILGLDFNNCDKGDLYESTNNCGESDGAAFSGISICRTGEWRQNQSQRNDHFPDRRNIDREV